MKEPHPEQPQQEDTPPLGMPGIEQGEGGGPSPCEAEQTILLAPEDAERSHIWLREQSSGTWHRVDRFPCTLGRDESCGWCLRDDSVSREHAHILRVDGGFGIEDLQSSNGLCVNGHQLQRALLVDGDEFQIGKTLVQFHLHGPEPAQEATPSPPPRQLLGAVALKRFVARVRRLRFSRARPTQAQPSSPPREPTDAVAPTRFAARILRLKFSAVRLNGRLAFTASAAIIVAVSWFSYKSMVTDRVLALDPLQAAPSRTPAASASLQATSKLRQATTAVVAPSAARATSEPGASARVGSARTAAVVSPPATAKASDVNVTAEKQPRAGTPPDRARNTDIGNATPSAGTALLNGRLLPKTETTVSDPVPVAAEQQPGTTVKNTAGERRNITRANSATPPAGTAVLDGRLLPKTTTMSKPIPAAAEQRQGAAGKDTAGDSNLVTQANPEPVKRMQKTHATRVKRDRAAPKGAPLDEARAAYLSGEADSALALLAKVARSSRYRAATKDEASRLSATLEDLYALYHSGQSAFAAGERDKAFATWRRFLEVEMRISPIKKSTYAREIRTLVVNDYLARTEQALDAGQAGEAHRLLERATRTDPNGPAADLLAQHVSTVKDLYQEAHRLETANLERAKALWRKVVEITAPGTEYHAKANAKLQWHARTESG